jgi:hypothetical protein
VDGLLVGHRPANPILRVVEHCHRGRDRRAATTLAGPSGAVDVMRTATMHGRVVNVRGSIDRPLWLFCSTSTAAAANATLES